MIVTHGWPGSIIEQMKIIGPLTDPTAHGGSASDAFHLVIPSLPGYGFSGKPTAPGWNPVSIARAWATLMQRLGYTRYVAQGGDWGNAVSEVMALQQPPGLLGIHTNMAATVPANISKALAFHEAPPADLSAEERNAWDQLVDFYGKGLGYALEMSHRPQTLYGLADSPVGLAAWMLDHDIRSYKMIARVFAGQPEGLTRDDVLDNVTLYWLTNTAISSARLYWDTTYQLPPGGFFDVRGIKIPVAVSAFPDEIYAAPRSWAEKAYPKLIHYNKLPKGGHFAAWEQPELFTAEMRAAFKSLRKRKLKTYGRPGARVCVCRARRLLRTRGLTTRFGSRRRFTPMKTNKLLASAVTRRSRLVLRLPALWERSRWPSRRHPRGYEFRSSTVSSTRKLPVKPSWRRLSARTNG